MRTISVIVEGHGEVEAVPHLIRKIDPDSVVLRPVRIRRSFLNDQNLVEKYTQIAKYVDGEREPSHILLIADADGECPAELGQRLLGWMSGSVPGMRCSVAIVVDEFESWIVGGIAELGVSNPEDAGSPKDRLRQVNHGRYKETVDQVRLTDRIDIDRLIGNSPSFARFVRIVRGLGSEDVEQ